jgi:hypothetical protein
MRIGLGAPGCGIACHGNQIFYAVWDPLQRALEALALEFVVNISPVVLGSLHARTGKSIQSRTNRLKAFTEELRQIARLDLMLTQRFG